ncbi:serine/threonine protein kinase [Archangium sp.]|uniref:serine/threonine protein kinase n=1 Tax=Archangium sp. TaxID=1872627 RepID=UPI003899FCE1
MTEAFHPDHFKPGDMVGPWRIVQVLGRGGSSRVFKVEREGVFYSLKMGLRPLSDAREELSEDEYVEERSAYRQMAREAAALLTYSSHPNLLRVYAVDFWPDPSMGYPILVTDFVDGDDWHRWRWRKPRHTAELVYTFSSVVRTVGVLHARGVYHRDLKAENILIRRADGRPFLIDFGTVRLPGALTKTMGVPEGVLHLLPPELLAYTRSGALGRGEPFQGGVRADLYALGVLLYQGLTDLHPFNPELPDKELVAAIATVPPAAPHLLNPLAPRSLSDIAMKLLEKKPENRYPSTDALLQALERASEQERETPSWKTPLLTAENSPPTPTPFEVEPQSAPLPETPREAQAETQPPKEEWAQAEGRQEPPAVPGGPRRARWHLVLLACLTLLGLVLGLAHFTLAPPPGAVSSPAPSDKGSPSMPSSAPHQDSTPATSRSGFLAAWLCAVAGLGCPAAQVKPPEPSDCPKDAVETMFQELKLREASELRAVVDINQPGDTSEEGVYQDGPVIGRLTVGDGNLPEGTLLHGRLWTGPGIYDLETNVERPAVMGRYTLAVLPDGRKFPVCIVLGNPDGRVPKRENSKEGTAVLNREVPVSAVWSWP